MRNSRITAALATALALASAGPAGASDDDHERARTQVERGTIRPLQEILKGIEAIERSRVLEVELEREHGTYVYEIEILTPDGRVEALRVDATDGRVLRRRLDD